MNARHVALAATAALATVACGSASGELTRGTAARQVIVALDLSGSQRDEDRRSAQAALDEIIEQLGFGDQLVLVQVHQRSAREAGRRWHRTVPNPTGRANTLDHEELAAAQRAARSVARAIFEDSSAGRLQTTDLFSTLHIAGEYRRDASERSTILVLLSDMLHAANHVNMERAGGVPSAGWIAAQKQRGTIPDLRGVCVAVVGADASTPHGVQVRQFWLEYFAQSGARLAPENYRLMRTGSATDGCA